MWNENFQRVNGQNLHASISTGSLAKETISRNSSLSNLFHKPLEREIGATPHMTNSIDLKIGQTDIDSSGISSISGYSRNTQTGFFPASDYQKAHRQLINPLHHQKEYLSGDSTSKLRDSLDIGSVLHQKNFHTSLKTADFSTQPCSGGKLSLRPQEVTFVPNEQPKFKFFEKLRQSTANPHFGMIRGSTNTEDSQPDKQKPDGMYQRNSPKSSAGVQAKDLPSKKQLCLKTQPGETPLSMPVPKKQEPVASGSLSPNKVGNVSSAAEYFGSPILAGMNHTRGAVSLSQPQADVRASLNTFMSPQTGRQLLHTVQIQQSSIPQQNCPLLSSRINVGLGKPIFRPSPSVVVGRSQLVGQNYSQLFTVPSAPQEFASTLQTRLHKDSILAEPPVTASSPRFLKLSASVPKIMQAGPAVGAHMLFPISGVRSSSQFVKSEYPSPMNQQTQPNTCLVSNVTFEHDNAGTAIPSRTLRFVDKPERESRLHSASKQPLSDAQSRNGSVALSQARGQKDRGLTDTSIDLQPFGLRGSVDHNTPSRWTPSTVAERGMLRSSHNQSNSQYLLDSPLKDKTSGLQAAYKPLTTRVGRRPLTCQTSPLPPQDSRQTLHEQYGISMYLRSLKPVAENSTLKTHHIAQQNSNNTECS